jgi:O-succinylbenzoic acid--CoA ligase
MELRSKGLVVAEADPVLFCAKFFAGLASDYPLWLRSHSSSRDDEKRFAAIFDTGFARPPGSLFLATGGTSGGLRFTRHSWAGLQAAVLNLQTGIGARSLPSWCCLPLRHVAGLMQVIRAVVSGADVFFGKYRDLATEAFSSDLIEDRLVSLVPTQLARLMPSSRAVAHLRTAAAVFVGGGPLQPDLARLAREAKLPISPTYGTTETAGMVTLLSPELFLSGCGGVGSALSGIELDFDEAGSLRIRSDSLCLGYDDRDFLEGAWFQTADFGFWDDHGSLRIEGRRDRLINTGGVKIDPNRVERSILETEMVEKCFVTSIPDAEWGQRLVAFCAPVAVNLREVEDALRDRLEDASVPKLFLSVDRLPLDEMDKPDAIAIASALKDCES